MQCNKMRMVDILDNKPQPIDESKRKHGDRKKQIAIGLLCERIGLILLPEN